MSNPSRCVLVPSIITIDSDIHTDTHRYVTGHFVSSEKIEFLARLNTDPKSIGINGSCVDQLVVKQDGQVFMRENRISPVLDVKPEAPEKKALVGRVCQQLNKLQGREPTPEKRERIKFTKSKSDLVPRTDAQDLAGIVIDEGHPTRDLRQKGRIPTTPGYSFTAKVYDEPSGHGIENGKISKLEVRKDGAIVINYDRGWDIPPQSPEHREAIQRIRNGFGDRHDRTVQDQDITQNTTHHVDR